MPFLLLVWNNKRWTLIIVLLILIFCLCWKLNSLSGSLIKTKNQCAENIKSEVAKAVKPYKDAEEKAQAKANKSSEEYEQSKSNESVKTETITREVQKIITQPIYNNVCFNDAGVSIINQAAGIADSSEPKTTLP